MQKYNSLRILEKLSVPIWFFFLEACPHKPSRDAIVYEHAQIHMMVIKGTSIELIWWLWWIHLFMFYGLCMLVLRWPMAFQLFFVWMVPWPLKYELELPKLVANENGAVLFLQKESELMHLSGAQVWHPLQFPRLLSYKRWWKRIVTKSLNLVRTKQRVDLMVNSAYKLLNKIVPVMIIYDWERKLAMTILVLVKTIKGFNWFFLIF